MKQYVHPSGRKAIKCKEYMKSYRVYNGKSPPHIVHEDYLGAWGFIEKEEEPDTKCIPNYIRGKTYMEGEIVDCKRCGCDCTDKRTPECPQKDTKWIDDVYDELQNDENSKGLSPGDQYYYLEKEKLKKSILSHLPKQWKT